MVGDALRPDERKFTPRGFEDFAEFTDSHGSTVVVRESSVSDGPCVWVLCYKGPEGSRWECTPHLDVVQARKLAMALTAFCASVEDAK